jgi:hypothetical protein
LLDVSVVELLVANSRCEFNFSTASPIHFQRGKNKIVKFFCFVFSFDEMLRNGEKIDKSREKEGIEGKTSSTLFGVRGGACYALQGNNYSLLYSLNTKIKTFTFF